MGCVVCSKWVQCENGNEKWSQYLKWCVVCSKCDNNNNNNNTLEKVEKFGYLGDMLNADDRTDCRAVIDEDVHGSSELSPILTFKGASLRVRGKVYGSRVRSCIVVTG